MTQNWGATQRQARVHEKKDGDTVQCKATVNDEKQARFPESVVARQEIQDNIHISSHLISLVTGNFIFSFAGGGEPPVAVLAS